MRHGFESEVWQNNPVWLDIQVHLNWLLLIIEQVPPFKHGLELHGVFVWQIAPEYPLAHLQYAVVAEAWTQVPPFKHGFGLQI